MNLFELTALQVRHILGANTVSLTVVIRGNRQHLASASFQSTLASVSYFLVLELSCHIGYSNTSQGKYDEIRESRENTTVALLTPY